MSFERTFIADHFSLKKHDLKLKSPRKEIFDIYFGSVIKKI